MTCVWQGCGRTFVLTLLPSLQIQSGLQPASRIYCRAGRVSPVCSPPGTAGEALGAGFVPVQKAKLRAISPPSSAAAREAPRRQKQVLLEVPRERKRGNGPGSRQGQVRVLREAVSFPILEQCKVNWRVPRAAWFSLELALLS